MHLIEHAYVGISDKAFQVSGREGWTNTLAPQNSLLSIL